MSHTTVAIVGRPNVGKSTLFNRLVGQPAALVDRTAGVTRDRHYGEVEWSGRAFRVVDTGGIVPSHPDRLMHAVLTQTICAVTEAHVLLLLVDIRQGVTPDDEAIALQLRKTGKKILLVANKAEALQARYDGHVFYHLGFGDPLLISAEHGHGVGDLLEAILQAAEETPPGQDTETGIQVAIVGRPNVGKSSLINRILGETRLLVDDVPGTTRDAIDTALTVGQKVYTFIDTAGMRKARRIQESLERSAVAMSLQRIQRCDVAVLIVDALVGAGDQEAHIASYIERHGKACIIAVNKWDAVDKGEHVYEAFVQTLSETLSFVAYVPILTLSALTGKRVVKLFPLIDTVFQETQRRLTTTQLNTFLKKVTAQHPAPSYRGKFIKFSFMLQTVTRPPTFLCFVNYPEGIHGSYQRFLQNQLRREFGFIGTPVRFLFRKK